MAKVVGADAAFIEEVKACLNAGLEAVGIKARIETEPVRGTRLHRFYVVARGFASMRPSERQNLVWRIVGQQFTPEQQLRISMILTPTDRDLVVDRG